MNEREWFKKERMLENEAQKKWGIRVRLTKPAFTLRILPVLQMWCWCTDVTELGIQIWKCIVTKRITTQFVTERLLTLKDLRHLKPSTRGNHRLVRCSRPSKWCTLLTWKRRGVCCSSNRTIRRHWFNAGFVRIMVKKHLRENPFTNGTNNLLKLVTFLLRKRNRADDQVTRLWSLFLRQQKYTRRARGNWVMSLTWQCWGCYVNNCLSNRTNFNCCVSRYGVWLQTGRPDFDFW
jgi:hypothetical protein